MLFQIQSYLTFLLKSRNRHGIHSPFVYSFITDCIYEKAPKSWYHEIHRYRQNLLNNQTTITVQDFGAGSKKLQQQTRKVSQIARNAGITSKRARLLGRIIHYFDIDDILEIGTSLGMAAASMSLANQNGHITTLEGCQNTAEIAIHGFEKFNLKNISTLVGDFKETLPKVLENNTFDLIYFDGNHQKEPTIQYFEQCLNHIHNNSIFIFDDIYWSKGMKEAWEYIKNDTKVTISMDTFRWGMVFFRSEQPKQHFTIRL